MTEPEPDLLTGSSLDSPQARAVRALTPPEASARFMGKLQAADPFASGPLYAAARRAFTEVVARADALGNALDIHEAISAMLQAVVPRIEQDTTLRIAAALEHQAGQPHLELSPVIDNHAVSPELSYELRVRAVKGAWSAAAEMAVATTQAVQAARATPGSDSRT